MSQCLRITCIVGRARELLYSIVEQQAERLDLEGVILPCDDTSIRVVACGSKEKIEAFLDALYQSAADNKLSALEVEPFLKDRDYRGIFRVVED